MSCYSYQIKKGGDKIANEKTSFLYKKRNQ